MVGIYNKKSRFVESMRKWAVSPALILAGILLSNVAFASACPPKIKQFISGAKKDDVVLVAGFQKIIGGNTYSSTETHMTLDIKFKAIKFLQNEVPSPFSLFLTSKKPKDNIGIMRKLMLAKKSDLFLLRFNPNESGGDIAKAGFSAKLYSPSQHAFYLGKYSLNDIKYCYNGNSNE